MRILALCALLALVLSGCAGRVDPSQAPPAHAHDEAPLVAPGPFHGTCGFVVTGGGTVAVQSVTLGTDPCGLESTAKARIDHGMVAAVLELDWDTLQPGITGVTIVVQGPEESKVASWSTAPAAPAPPLRFALDGDDLAVLTSAAQVYVFPDGAASGQRFTLHASLFREAPPEGYTAIVG